MNSDQEVLKRLPDMQEGMQLLHLATMADIPISVMTWLVNHAGVESVRDLTILRYDDLLLLRGEYPETAPPYASHWSFIVLENLEYLIQWLISFRHIFGGYPHPCVLTKEYFEIAPEHLQQYWKKHGSQFEAVTFPAHSNPILNTIPKRSNYHILAYPRFSGLAKDWIEFERSFRVIATAQGFANILQEEITVGVRFSPEYSLDCTFIYNVLQHCWSKESETYYLVQQHASTKNGRQVYLDAQHCFHCKC